MESVVCVAGLLFGLPVVGFAQNYRITDLGSNTWYYSDAHGLNNLGNVAGEYEPIAPPALQSGFFYSDGLITDVGHFGGPSPYTLARAVNDANVVVGEASAANNAHAFSYSNGIISDLGSRAGPTGYSSAFGINRAGEIAGESSLSLAQSGTIHAMVYSGGTWKDLGALGGSYSAAFGINNSNIVVGESEIVEQGATYVHAFVLTNGTQAAAMHDLGTLPGGTYSSAKAVNDSGVIVGESEINTNGTAYLRAFIYQNGLMSSLGTLGGNVSSASAINSAGQVVGYATDTNGVAHGFLHTGTTMLNLDELIPAGSSWTNLAAAEGINDAGQIVGYGYLANGEFHAYLLDPSHLRVAITNPVPNAKFTFQAPATFLVEASASDADGTVTNVEFLVNGQSIGNAPAAPFSATASNLTAGSYTITAVASDNAGLYATNSITVIVQRTPPTVTITNPLPDATLQAPATFLVEASAADADGTVTNVEFRVNGQSIGNATTAPFSATATNLNAGSYILTAVASDNAGLSGTNSISVIVADTPPTVTITNPFPDASFQAPATFLVEASAADADGTVTNVEFLVNGQPIGNATTAPFTATASNLNAGTYVLAAVASDNAGLNATNSITVVVADTPPTVTITNPLPDATFQPPATFLVEASSSDADGTVTNVEFLVNGQPIGNATTAPFAATASYLGVGSYTLTAIASDNAGLTATNNVTITVANGSVTPVTILNPAFDGSSFTFSFATQIGYTYTGQFTSPLSVTNDWLEFTNLIGDGSVVRVTDSSPTNGLRFYRVLAH